MSKIKQKAPKLRFPEFMDDWEQRKLGKCAEFNPKSELPDTFEYVDLESVVGTDILSHRTESKSSAPSRAQRLAKKGDVFYQTVRPYQKNNCIFEKDDNNWVFSTGYVQLRPVNDGYFLLTLLQNEDFVKLVLDRCTGTSYPAINSNDLADIEVNIPSDNKEQQKIGTYFKNLDHLITLHQRKCDELKEFKKGMFQKMFPKKGETIPEIRFPGFTDAWEQRKFGDVVQTRRGLTYKPANIQDNGIRVLRSSNINEDVFVYGDEDIFVNPNAINIEFVKRNDILITSANGSSRLVGKHALIKEIPDDSAVHGGFMLLGRTKNYNFINASMSSSWYTRFINVFVAGGNGAIGNLNKNDLDEQIILVPSDKEQRQIGNFFSNLDNLITLHQRKVDEYKELKKGLLQQMFI